jgi:hypothetical protein
MSDQLIQTISAVAQSVLALGTFVLSYVIWKASVRASRADFTRSMQDYWNTINSLALSDDELLRIADTLNGPNIASDSIETRKRRWFSFFYINAFHTTFLAMESGLLERAYALQTLEQLMVPILADDDFFRLTQERGYHSKFAEFCQQHRPNALSPGSATRDEAGDQST